MKAFKHVRSHFHVPGPGPLRTKNLTGVVHLNAISYHSFTESHLDPQSSEWREKALPKLIKLTPLLKNLDLINGKLVNLHDKCTVNDEFLLQSMRTFKPIATAFLMKQALSTVSTPCLSVDKPLYMETFTLNSLKKVCNILDVSAQQRKLVRLAICPQVTQHQIWTGALEEILNQLKFEMSVNDYGCIMAQQIVVNCLKFLDDVMSYDPESTSWMRLTLKKDANLPPYAKWEDFLEMINDLMICLKNEEGFFFYVTKLETMKEGLSQIKDVLVDKNIGYKEVRHQQSLVQKKLTKSLGHSSKCLFTLLLYYLYGSIRDIELDICCWFSEGDVGNKCYLCVGKILISDEEKMLRREVKKLDRALRVIKFVYEMAEMKEILELQGHVWCLGCENRSLVYRGHKFFIHGISL
ncbi:unnamed protein product [Lactuca virosa]|uniref:Uncharacterized protein n=1 Tax=Lactuca virosa TaxID=75947 RepID=A0AAU9NDR8_9ASTR|nr:unnamed protein product [Lactuca virosa]